MQKQKNWNAIISNNRSFLIGAMGSHMVPMTIKGLMERFYAIISCYTILTFLSTPLLLPLPLPLPLPLSVQRIASSLHRLLQYMCAYVELGGESDWVNNTVLDKKEYGGAWGGTEGIGQCSQRSWVNEVKL